MNTQIDPRGLWRIEPQNEGQELNYVEHWRGSGRPALIRYCAAIIRALSKTLRHGEFTVRVIPPGNHGRVSDESKAFIVSISRTGKVQTEVEHE